MTSPDERDFPSDTLTGNELSEHPSGGVDDKQRRDVTSAGAQTVGQLKARTEGPGVEPVHEVVEDRQIAVDREAAAGPSI